MRGESEGLAPDPGGPYLAVLEYYYFEAELFSRQIKKIQKKYLHV